MTAPTSKEPTVTEPSKPADPKANGGTQGAPSTSVFLADYGVHLDDLGVHFTPDLDAAPKVAHTGQQGGVGSRTYRFETRDATVAGLLRELAAESNEYGIRELQREQS